MSKFLQSVVVWGTALMLSLTMSAQQLTNANFEDWSGAAFDGKVQPKGWNASNVEQFGFKFNFAHKEDGHNGGSSMMVQDQAVGAAGITETSPGYFSLGQPWAYVPGLTSVGQATAGTSGGILWTYRPDSMSVWIRRTGNNTDKEDFYLLYYAWEKDAKGTAYKGKNGNCTPYTQTNEESDVRIALNGNECSTQTAGDQISEGMWREKATYNEWTNIRVPIYYLNSNKSKWMNIIFSASNYPNFRANSGLYEGNSLYVDDVELIYSSKIQTLLVDGMTWNGFDPNSSDVQVYALGESATAVPTITAKRGAGSLTNAKGTTKTFPGRFLEEGANKEMTIQYGDLENTPTVITVRAEDGSSTTVYKIQFKRAASSNAKLAGISYILDGQETAIADFSPTASNYTIALPYGTTDVPQISFTLQENGQTATVTQAASLQGQAVIHVTAPNGTDTRNYTVSFTIAELADNNLAGIKVNNNDLPGFNPTQSNYKVSLPVGTQTLTVVPVKKYDGQTVVVTPATMPTGTAIDGTVVEISVTTPGNSTPRKYRLTIKLEASSYSYLANLTITGEQILKCNPHIPEDSTVIEFTPENMIYYVTLKMGTTQLPDITATKGDEYQLVPIIDSSAGVDGTTRITATAANGDQSMYKVIFNTMKSSCKTLSDIKIGGESLAGFAPNVTSYTYALPVGTTKLPTIEAVPGDEYQNVVVTTAGLTGKTRITVTAGDGGTMIYQISFSVEAFTDNTLADLAVADYSLQNRAGENVEFNPDTTEYWVYLPQGTTERPEVTYTLKNDSMQSASPRGSKELPCDYRVTVRPQNGASLTYIIHFSAATSNNTNLTMIYLDGTPIQNFRSDSLNYIDSLPEGITRIPTVTFDKAEKEQRVVSVLDGKKQTITVTAQDGKTKVDYTITFIVRASANAYLDMIYLDSVVLSGFNKKILEYTVTWTKSQCPKITVDAAPGQQVTIAAPYNLGDATIKVLSETGDVNTYTIHFIPAPMKSVQLANIAINGVGVSGFRSDSLSYTATFAQERPMITYTLKDISQTVTQVWKGDVAYLHVTDAEGNKGTYTIAFTRLYSDDTTLKSIKVDGAPIENPFVPTKRIYTTELPAGSAYPEITYEANDESQVVYFGQLSAGEWDITVQAENGDTAHYHIRYTIKKYDDATLDTLGVVGKTMSPAYNQNILDYAVTIDEGAKMPELIVRAREGQTVLQSNVDDTHQQVIVYAESGATKTYTITYTRVPSSNALLEDILINGVSIEGFDPMVEDYIDTLEWRSTVVPHIYPVTQQDNQTVTTYFCRPNGITTIHVEAQDGTTKDYHIEFPVRKSSNNKLGDLMLDDASLELVPAFNADSLNYTVAMPVGATQCGVFTFEKAKENSKTIDEQRIDLISRPLGDTTKIIVTAENGDQRTYNIYFKESYPEEANYLSAIRIIFDNDPETEIEFKKPKTKRDTVLAVPFGTRMLDVTYEKMYPEQTVFVQPGGVHHPTILTVKSNRPDEADVVYTITPNLATADPAVLTDIRINGTSIENFASEKFSYVVNVTEKPILRYTVNKGAEINILEQTQKHWKAEVTYGSRTNTYEVWYYYPNEQVPNTNFTSFVSATVATDRKKPEGWNSPADAVEHDTWGDPGEYVQQSSEGVKLISKYSGWHGGTIPGFITLGNVTGHWGAFGATSFDITGGITFHNSPDVMEVRCNISDVYKNTLIKYVLTGSDDVAEIEFKETSTTDGFTTFMYPLKEANDKAGEPTNLNIIISSYYITDGDNLSHNGTMNIDSLHFYYNHTLDSLDVDAFRATQSGNAFTARLTDPERIEKPILKFFGHVEDQSPLVTWSAESLDGDTAVRHASIRNYAENGTDYTDYELYVRRPLDKRNKLADLKLNGATITGFDPDTKNYTVDMTYKQLMPDLMPVAASSLQTITTSFNATTKTMTITVTPEKGEPTVYTVHFNYALSSDATLDGISAEGLTPTFDAGTTDYTITAEQWPIITITKKSDLQKVELINGILTVTAEDGTTTGTYTITRVDPVPVTDAKLTTFNVGGEPIGDLGGDTKEKSAEKPSQYVSFVRQFDTDSVVFIQCDTAMLWNVYGTVNETYKWLYPQTLSDNTDLAKVTINGVEYEEYLAGNLEYDIYSDSTIVLVPVAANLKQSLTSTYESVDGGVLFKTRVKAENGDEKTYSFTIAHKKDSVATLAGILLDGVLIDGFHPDTLNYDIVIPTPAVKQEQPLMPSVAYVMGGNGQKIELVAGELNGAATEIRTEAEDGVLKLTYSVTVRAQKSACVDLTGITINGEPVDQFEPGRHYYSKSIKTNTINVDYTADDRFLTVTPVITTISENRQYNYELKVTAENGDTAQYEIMIYVENQSNDAQLANILLDGKDFVDFQRALNPDLSFKSTVAEYDINLPSGTTVWPEVSAQLKMDGQTVAITQLADSILLDVTAVDGTPNQYVLHFLVPQSRNANLSMIFLDGDSINNFEPETYFYQHNLKVGVHALPEVTGQKAEGTQLIAPVEVDEEKRQATIKVQAEDRSYSTTYVVAFQFTQSDVDTLSMIFENGDPLPGFDPYVKYYERTLPVGTAAFPELYWQDGDDYQTVHVDTVSGDSVNLVRQIVVTSESMRTRTYTVSYMIEKSAVDTLGMIFIDQKQVPNFKPSVFEYNYTLSAQYAAELDGNLPSVEYIAGDDYQSVMVSQMPEDTYVGNSLNQKSVITVTAANGFTKTYIIHYPVELSDDAKLNMIMLEGKPLSNFDAERYNYRVEIEAYSAVPVVSVIKKEEAQTYEIRVMNDTVRIVVLAESKQDSAIYQLAFERVLSGNTKLNNIILTDQAGAYVTANQFRFNPAWDSYTIDLNWEPGVVKDSLLPTMEFDLADTLQSVRVEQTELEDGSIQVEIIVTAANKDEGSYFITFKFTKPGDNTLKALFLNGVALPDFSPMELEYTYQHPYGTDEADYFTPAQLSYILSDSLATAVDSINDNHTLFVTVTAQNGKQRVYAINQVTGEDDNADLAWIAVDGDLIQDFDPNVTFYTYDVYKGAATPSITAEQASPNASAPTVDDISKLGDTCNIRVKAANGDVKVYQVYIRETLDKGLEASANDVIIKRIPGTAQYFVASIRSGVKFALFDLNRQVLLDAQAIPEANLNYAEVYKDTQDKDVLGDVVNMAEGLIVNVDLGKPYIYVFWYNNKKVKSGVIIAQ